MQTEAIAHQPEADSFQFEGALRTIRQAILGYAWAVLATAALTVSLVAAYVWIWPPTFQAEVMIAVDSDKDIQKTAFYQGWNIFRKDGLTDEATLMTGPAVMREVIKRLNLKYEDVYHPFTRYAIHLWTTSWLGRNYRDLKNWITGKEANPNAPTAEQLEMYKVLSDMQSGISVRQVGEASIGLLVVKGSNLRVAEIANTIVDVYLEQRRERFITEARQAVLSLTKEADRTQAELEQLDKEVKKFRADTGVVLLFEKDRGQINQLLALNSAVTDLEAVAAENEAALRVVDGQLAAEGAKLRSDRVFKEDAHKDRLPKLELALAGARQSFQPNSREVLDLEEQIREAQAGIAENSQSVVVRSSAKISENYEVLRAKKLSIESVLAGARSALQVKRRELDRMRSVLDQLPQKMQVNHEFERRQGFLENKYAGLNAKLTVAAVSMATAESAPAAMRVVEPASVPEQAIAPQTKLLLAAALVAGLVLGTILALLLDALSKKVTRHRLAAQDGTLATWGVVEQEEQLLQKIFPRRPVQA